MLFRTSRGIIQTMKFLKELFDSFIPHADNEYKPHFFRLHSVLVVAAIILVFGTGTLLLQKTIIEKTNYLAAVISSAIVDLTNSDRQTNSLQELAVNPLLERGAQMKADDMAAKGYFAHTSPEGLTPWYWFKQTGYNFVYAGENLAVRFNDSVDVERAWMNSPGHRANILNTHFTEIGVGVAQGTFEGQTVVFVVQEFGAPAPGWTKFPDTVTKVAVASTTTTAASSTSPVASTSPSVAGDTKQEATSTKPKTLAVVKSASTDTTNAEVGKKKTDGPEHTDPEPTPKVILSNDTFIAVKNEVATNSPLSALVVSPDSSMSLAHKLITSPKSVVESIYIVLTAIITLALVVMIFVEIRRQHPKNVALGVLLLVLMGGILVLGQVLSPGTLSIL